METLTFEINKTAISLTSYTCKTPYLTGRNTDYCCVFNIVGDEWDGLIKRATFHNINTDIKKTEMLVDGQCHIPFSVLTYGTLEVGIVGLDGEQTIKSSLLYRLSVQRDAGENDEDMPDPDPTLFEELMEMVAACGNASITGAYTNADGYLVIVTADGREIVSEAKGLPPVTAEELNMVMQVGQNGWQVQKPVLDDDSVHVLSNMEIELLLENFQ
jgi:hypothetical protein